MICVFKGTVASYQYTLDKIIWKEIHESPCTYYIIFTKVLVKLFQFKFFKRSFWASFLFLPLRSFLCDFKLLMQSESFLTDNSAQFKIWLFFQRNLCNPYSKLIKKTKYWFRHVWMGNCNQIKKEWKLIKKTKYWFRHVWMGKCIKIKKVEGKTWRRRAWFGCCCHLLEA